MRDITKAKQRRSARHPSIQQIRTGFRPAARLVSALRDASGLWTAKSADGKVVAYFDENFAKAIARQIYAYGPGETPIHKSGSIAEPRTQRGITDDRGVFHSRD